MASFGIIYRIRNIENNKVYIGQTTRTELVRWHEHMHAARKGRGHALGSAIRKYGETAFALEILYNAKAKVELDRMETFFIILHQSHLSENGYNLAVVGGANGSSLKGRPSNNPQARGKGFHLSFEHKMKISIARKGKPSPKKGKPSGLKGLSYEELFGKEKADKLKQEKSRMFKEAWRQRKAS